MTNVVHNLPYPAVDIGNLSFPRGTYDVNVRSLAGGTSVQVTHKLENAKFIENLLETGKAKYGCLLAVPVTGHRKLSLYDEPIQNIKWDIGIVGEPPIIRPIIVVLDQFEHKFSRDDDVAEIWIGKTAIIPKGARLARGKYLRSNSSFESLLVPRLNNDIPNGSFFVSSNENQGYKFNVDVAPDLYDFLNRSISNESLYRSIAVHMASMCFTILQNEQGIEDEDYEKWREHSNLQMLTGLLEAHGLQHWTDEDFRPDKVALQLYPLILPTISEEE